MNSPTVDSMKTDYDLRLKNHFMDNQPVIQPKIFLGAPVRNRAWVLPRYIEAILNQNIPIDTLFIINDCDDNTEGILEEAGFNFIKRDFGHQHGHIRGQYSKDNLATLRNILLEEFLKSECDYLLSIDTDIIIPKGSVEQLIADDRDIVSMLIKNSDVLSAHNFFINGKHVEDVAEGLLPVDMTGAVYLIKRKIIESGVRYAYHQLGEDIPFCNSAKEKGFEIYCDTRLKPIHVFRENLDLIAKTSKSVSPIDITQDIKNKILDLLDSCQKAVIYLNQCLIQENIEPAIYLIQHIIDALNKIGEKLEVFKSRTSYKLLEEKFYVINNSIGLIFSSLEQNNNKRVLDLVEKQLVKNINEWKNLIENFLK